MIYEDATNSADTRVDYPEYVEGFVALGFDQIGRVLGIPQDQSVQEVADYYGEDSETVFAHMTTPTPVLRSQDTPAFVDVSWHFDSPSVRIRTQFDDGYIVATLRRWDTPIWGRPGEDIDKMMLFSHAPDTVRSTRVVSSSSCAELWAAHLEHVAEVQQHRSTVFSAHVDLDDYIRLANASFAHDQQYLFSSAKRFPAGKNLPKHELPNLETAHLWTSMYTTLFVAILLLAALAFFVWAT